MLDWFGGVFHPTFINFRRFRTFARSNCNSNFLMCFRILNFVSITNIYCGWGRHKTMYYNYSSDEQDTPDMTVKTFESHLKQKNTAKKAKEEKEKEGKKINSKKTAKKTNSKGWKDWMDEEISLLIDMLEEKPCLWDVFDKEYTKRDVKEIAYTKIASSLDTNIEFIKAKINGLRAQLGREVAKVNKTKCGQSTDTLKRENEEENEEVEETRFFTPGLKKKTMTERKIELLSKCTEATTKKPVKSADSKHSAFAPYVDENFLN